MFKICLMALTLTFSGVSHARVEDVKNDIIDLAREFKGTTDPTGEKQEQLEERVEDLLAFVPNFTMEEKVLRAAGAWKQVWGPYAFNGSSGIPTGLNIDKIFQVLSKDGYYYNFAQYELFGLTFRSFLRGNYEIESDRVTVEFTNSGLILGEEDTPMYKLTDELENDEIRTIRFPSFLPPIGIEGSLIEVYADEDIRINYGTSENQPERSIFILKRVEL